MLICGCENKVCLQPIRELGTIKAWVPLLHPQGYCAVLGAVVHKHQSWVELSVNSLLWKLEQHFLVLQNCTSGKGYSNYFHPRDLWALHLKCMVSSTFLTLFSALRSRRKDYNILFFSFSISSIEYQQLCMIFKFSFRNPGIPIPVYRDSDNVYTSFTFQCLRPFTFCL